MEQRRVEEAKRELDSKRRALEEQRERQQREAEQAEKDRKADEQREWERTSREKEQAEKAHKDKVLAVTTKIGEQRSRANYAESVFSEINLKPEFFVNEQLKALGAQVEFRGKEHDELVALHRNRNWLGLIMKSADMSYTEYPTSDIIRTAAEKVQKWEFHLVLRCPVDKTGDVALVTAQSLARVEYDPVYVDWVSQKHPDGIGYITDWNPDRGAGVFACGDLYGLRNKIDKINEQYRNESRGLAQKKQLAEISETDFRRQRTDLIIKAQKAAFELARQ